MAREVKAGTTKRDKERILILGSGWAAISLLRELDTKLYEVNPPVRGWVVFLLNGLTNMCGVQVVVVSPRNYFLFTPLLPSVTVGTLDSRR